MYVAQTLFMGMLLITAHTESCQFQINTKHQSAICTYRMARA